MKSLRFYAFFLLLPCLLLDALQGLAVDIPKGTFYFDNSRTRYPTVKFTYGTNDPTVSYIVQMTDEGDNIWSITFDEAVPNMYRYFFSGTSMEVGTWQMSFYDLKEYVSKTLNEYRTATCDYPIPVGAVFTPQSGDNWAQGEWKAAGGGDLPAWSGTLPVLFINTEKAVTSKTEYVSGTYYIDPLGIEGYQPLGSSTNPLPLLIKGRGNYTWKDFQKKPYRLKLEEKAKPLGMKKSRHFTLLAHADDDLAFLRNTVGFELSRLLGLKYTPEQEPVEVVLNGDYIGLYMLTDKIRVDKNRVNIVEQADQQTHPDSITGGWLVEIDNYEENGQIRMKEGNGADLRFTLHTPEVLSNEQREYIVSLLTATDQAIYNSNKNSQLWEQYIDMDSLARFYIVQEVMDNAESFHGSCFIHKEMGSNTKLIFGPVWDFGNAFHRGYDRFVWQDPPFGQNWIGEIARYPRFQERVKAIWQPFLGMKYPHLEAFIDQFINKISAAAACDARRWPQYGTSDARGRATEFKQRMARKVDFLRGQWGNGVVSILSMETAEQVRDTWQTLDGRRLNSRPTQRGVYLHNGRKVIVSGAHNP